MEYNFKELNSKIIKFDSSYEFGFYEDPSMIRMHPVSNYYFKLDDLSINLLISFKWILWGYVFFDSISKNLIKMNDDDYMWSSIISKSIQNDIKIDENKHLFFLDDTIINTIDDLYKMIETCNLYKFDENDKIHFKLKINLREYIILSNLSFPGFTKYNYK